MFTALGFKLLLFKVFWVGVIFVLSFAFGAYRTRRRFFMSNEGLIKELALAKQQLVAFEQVQQAEISHVVEKVLTEYEHKMLTTQQKMLDT